MENALGFTTSEFMRLQQQVSNLLKIKNDLEAELAIWKPAISVEVTEIAGQPAVSYRVQYGKDGVQQVYTAAELSNMQAEVLADVVHHVAEQTTLLKTKMIKDMIIPIFQRAADYSKTVCKTTQKV